MGIIKILKKSAIKLILVLITFYQLFISVYLPPSCKYNPTCSQYAKDAFIKHGFLKGFYLSIRRLLRCHPFAKGGDDFVK
jgi:putative membrane protein insertion efficiency factor